MAKNDEKPGLLQLGACGSGRFSQPARYRVSCGLEMDVEMLSATFVAFWAPRLGARPSKTPHEVVSWRCRLASGGKLASDPLFTSTRVHSIKAFNIEGGSCRGPIFSGVIGLPMGIPSYGPRPMPEKRCPPKIFLGDLCLLFVNFNVSFHAFGSPFLMFTK